MNGVAITTEDPLITRTGQEFIKQNARLEQEKQDIEREIAAIARRSFPDVIIGSFATESEADRAQTRALAEKRAPLLAVCRARLTELHDEQHELGKCRDAEVAALHLRRALGAAIPIVELPPLETDDDRLARLRRTRAELTVQRDAADTARAQCAERMQAATTRARELASLAITKECKPGEFATARQATDDAAADLARADERLLAVSDALARVDRERSERTRQVQDAWMRERLVEYRASVQRFAASLRSAAGESVRLRQLFDAVNAVQPDAAAISVPTVFFDLTDPSNSIRRWLDEVVDLGLLTKEGVQQ